MLFHTIPEILSYAKKTYGADDAIRWKKSKSGNHRKRKCCGSNRCIASGSGYM